MRVKRIFPRGTAFKLNVALINITAINILNKMGLISEAKGYSIAVNVMGKVF
jgi:hypothetical protein